MPFSSRQKGSDLVDLDQIGVARVSRGVTARDDDAILLGKAKLTAGDLLGGVEQDVGGGKGLAHGGDHAPGERKAAPGAFVGGQADDGNGCAEARDHSGGHAREGAGHDGLGVDVDGHSAGRVRHGVGHVADLEGGIVEALLVVDVALGGLGDLGHGLDRLHGVLAGGRLTREHDGAGAVVNGVGNIRDLGSGRTGIADHGFQHFGCGDHALAEHTAFGDELFLNGGKMLEWDLHAHVAARDHDAVAALADLVDVVHAGLILDLGDQLNVLGVDLLHIGAHVEQILLAGDEGAGDVVDAVLHAEKDILLVLLGEVGLLHHLAGEAHALAVRKLAAADDAALDVGSLDPLHEEGEQTVVEQNGVACRKLLGELGIADRNALAVAEDLVGGKGEAVTVREMDPAPLKGFDAVFGSLGVQHDGDGETELLAHLLDQVDAPLVIGVRIV